LRLSTRLSHAPRMIEVGVGPIRPAWGRMTGRGSLELTLGKGSSLAASATNPDHWLDICRSSPPSHSGYAIPPRYPFPIPILAVIIVLSRDHFWRDRTHSIYRLGHAGAETAALKRSRIHFQTRGLACDGLGARSRPWMAAAKPGGKSPPRASHPVPAGSIGKWRINPLSRKTRTRGFGHLSARGRRVLCPEYPSSLDFGT
jgi:hypothetical protein